MSDLTYTAFAVTSALTSALRSTLVVSDAICSASPLCMGFSFAEWVCRAFLLAELLLLALLEEKMSKNLGIFLKKETENRVQKTEI